MGNRGHSNTATDRIRRPGGGSIRGALVTFVLLTGVLRGEGSAPTGHAPPARLDLKPIVGGLLKDPARMLELIPMPLSPTDRYKTLMALARLFSRSELETVRVEPDDLSGPDDRRPRHVTLVTRNVDLFGLNLDRLTMEALDAVLDPEALLQGRMTLIAPTRVRIEARVEEDDLDRAAQGYVVRLRPGIFSLSGTDKLLFIKTRYELRARLSVNEANQLEMDPRKLRYGIVPVPRPVVTRVLASVNPLFDLDKFMGNLKTWVKLRLQDPRIEQERMFSEVVGTVNPVAAARQGVSSSAVPPPPAENLPGSP